MRIFSCAVGRVFFRIAQHLFVEFLARTQSRVDDPDVLIDRKPASAIIRPGQFGDLNALAHIEDEDQQGVQGDVQHRTAGDAHHTVDGTSLERSWLLSTREAVIQGAPRRITRR